jgi:hypothetical protein
LSFIFQTLRAGFYSVVLHGYCYNLVANLPRKTLWHGFCIADYRVYGGQKPCQPFGTGRGLKIVVCNLIASNIIPTPSWAVGVFPLHKVKGKKTTHRQPSVGCVKGYRNSQFFLFTTYL